MYLKLISISGRDLLGVKVIENLDKVVMVTEEKIYFINHTVLVYRLSLNRLSTEDSAKQRPKTQEPGLTCTDSRDAKIMTSSVWWPTSQPLVLLHILDVHRDILPKKTRGRQYWLL